MNYMEYKKIREEGVNALPIFWAFSEKQFEEGYEKLGLKKDEKVIALGAGGFFPASEKEKVLAFFKSDNIAELMEDYDFAFEAFYYEMGNHEYHINYYQGDWDVLNCFYNAEWLGDSADCMDYLNSLAISDTTKKAYLNARDKFLKDAADNDWY